MKTETNHDLETAQQAPSVEPDTVLSDAELDTVAGGFIFDAFNAVSGFVGAVAGGAGQGALDGARAAFSNLSKR